MKILPTARIYQYVSGSRLLLNVKERKIYLASLIIIIEINYAGYISVYITTANRCSVNILPVNMGPIMSSIRIVKKIDRVCDTLYTIMILYKLLTAPYKSRNTFGEARVINKVCGADVRIVNSN
jgi:hypothetical protein